MSASPPSDQPSVQPLIQVCPHKDLINPDVHMQGLPFEWLKDLRNNAPVSWLESDEFADGGIWVITKREHIDYISKHPKLFSSWERTCFLPQEDPEMIDTVRQMMINMDPPDHVQYRRIVRTAFTPRTVDAYEPRFREIAKDIVDRVAGKGECEFVEDVAAELPLIAICELMGIPIEDRKDFFNWTNTMIGRDDPDFQVSDDEALTAQAQVYMYGQKLADMHRENPRDNIVGQLLDGNVDGEVLSEDEFRNFFMLLIVAGNETTRTVTSHAMRLLMEHPEQLQMLVDEPDRIPDFIEEALRYHTAVVQFTRTATEDIEVGGQHIKQGQRVVMFYHSANRDEDVFPDADTFDITRPRREDVRNGHRAFGVGEHFCLGTHLARLELLCIFDEVIPRLRNPKLAKEPRWLRSTLINGVKEMYITFEREVV